MKAIAHAPEKLYLIQDNGLVCYCKSTDEDIEYTRTDIFVEKAVKWHEEHKEAVETEDNGIMGWIPDYFIKDFRNYMKEE